MEHESIQLRDLLVRTRLGVPAVERATPQTVRMNVHLEPLAAFAEAGDQLERTVDYHAVARRIAEVAGRGERRLAESLAAVLAADLLDSFPLRAVEIAIDKHILPQAGAVGVRVRRERRSSDPGASPPPTPGAG